MSPPATEIATTGLPSRKISVGDSVTRGRFPGSIALAVPWRVLRLVRRVPCMMPVSPATPAMLSSPLGVAAITLPQRSVTHIMVLPRRESEREVGCFTGFMLYGSPGRIYRDAFFMSINGRRMRVYRSEGGG